MYAQSCNNLLYHPFPIFYCDLPLKIVLNYWAIFNMGYLLIGVAATVVAFYVRDRQTPPNGLLL